MRSNFIIITDHRWSRKYTGILIKEICIKHTSVDRLSNSKRLIEEVKLETRNKTLVQITLHMSDAHKFTTHRVRVWTVQIHTSHPTPITGSSERVDGRRTF